MFSMKPIFKDDKISIKKPIISDKIQAISIFSYMLSVSTCYDIVILIIIHTTATGPIAICGEVPKNAYIIKGVIDAYSPKIGGKPAIAA